MIDGYVRDAVDERVFIFVVDTDELGVQRDAVVASRRPVHRRAVNVVTRRQIARPAGRATDDDRQQPTCIAPPLSRSDSIRSICCRLCCTKKTVFRCFRGLA